PALGLAERDRHAGELEASRAEYVLNTTRDLVEEFGESVSRLEGPQPSLSVVCVPSRDEADATVNVMLVHALRANGFKARALAVPQHPGDIADLNKDDMDVLIVSALPPLALIPARSLCRRFRKANPEIKIVLAVWQSENLSDEIQKRLGGVCIDSVVVSVAEAVERMKEMKVLEATPVQA
ncbi:MAG: putative phytochrome sensor protein, partial [Bryobacterales bacterium]|nr:putative phytochrome sensor protein [Bryobacterales bacterium]